MVEDKRWLLVGADCFVNTSGKRQLLDRLRFFWISCILDQMLFLAFSKFVVIKLKLYYLLGKTYVLVIVVHENLGEEIF